MSNPFSTPERMVNYVAMPPPITPPNASVAKVRDMNIDPLNKNTVVPPQNQELEPVNLFAQGELDDNNGFGGRKRSSKKHRRGKKAKRTNKKTRRFFRFGGMDPFATPPNSPPRLTMPPPVTRAPRVNQPAPAGVFQGQNLMAQFNAIDNRDEEGYTDSEDMSGGADKRPRSYTTSSESRDVKKPRYSPMDTNSSTETINSSTSYSVGSLTSRFGETNITSSMSPDKDMSAINGNTKGGYRRKTKRRTSRKRRTTRK